MKKAFAKKYNKLVRQVRKYIPEDGRLDLLSKAFWFGFDAHRGQFRRSGDPYFEHCVAAAYILSELNMDITTIAAGLLHDVVEDTGVTIAEVENEFGGDIATLVDGVTKISDLRFKSAEIKQEENFRKMLLTMARDIRVVMIKFADRLHNMRTLEFLPARKQVWIAQETLDVYAPLAHRFGIARLARQLEDLALKYIDAEAYTFIDQKIGEKYADRMKHIEIMKKPILRELEKLNIPCSIIGRPKSYFSIYKKMKRQNIPFAEIYDLLALRIITEKKEACYAAVGVLHTLYTPVADRFKDYIATPKQNGYQSIHTTVINPTGRMMEVQIRTRAMDDTAELGIAAHWAYKTDSNGREYDKHLSWVRQFLDFNVDYADPGEFMQSFKFDLVQDEIFVFTPHGRLVNLPVHATPVDFAFAVHSEVGMTCIGAKVNSKIVPLNTTLHNGDEVEILTSSKPNPQEYWGSFVVTSRARSQINRWHRENRKLQYEQLGREMLEKEMLKYGLSPDTANKKHFSSRSGYNSFKGVCLALGRQEVSPREIVKRVFPREFKKSRVSLFHRIPRLLKKAVKDERFVVIHGDSPLIIELSTCCMPVPGDKIVGFYREDKGVTVHRNKCKDVPGDRTEAEHGVRVDWARHITRVFPAALRVTSADRMHLLRDIAVTISSMDINITGIHIEVKDTLALCDIKIEVRDRRQLTTVMQRLSKIQGVQRVKR